MYFPLELFAFSQHVALCSPSPPVPVQEHTAEPETQEMAKLGWVRHGNSSRDVFLISIPRTGLGCKETCKRSFKGQMLPCEDATHGGRESPSLKGEMHRYGRSQPSPETAPPGTSCCGTNPSFTQDLQNVLQDVFFLNRLHQVKGLDESKRRVLLATIHPKEHD